MLLRDPAEKRMDKHGVKCDLVALAVPAVVFDCTIFSTKVVSVFDRQPLCSLDVGISSAFDEMMTTFSNADFAPYRRYQGRAPHNSGVRQVRKPMKTLASTGVARGKLTSRRIPRNRLRLNEAHGPLCVWAPGGAPACQGPPTSSKTLLP